MAFFIASGRYLDILSLVIMLLYLMMAQDSGLGMMKTERNHVQLPIRFHQIHE